MNKELKKKLALLNKQLRSKIFIGTSKAYNNEIRKFFSSHPTGVGYTLKYFKPVTVSGNKTQDMIAFFSKGYPAILQLGVDGSAKGYIYPYNPETGSFIRFEDSPNLEEWASKNYASYKPSMQGLFVGKETTTSFGIPSNQWVTRSGEGLKSNGDTRSVILAEMRNIKLN